MVENHGNGGHDHPDHDEFYGVLPVDGIVDLTDKLTGYMNEIEHGGLTDIMGQVLDDFLEQAGGMPEDMMASDAFEQISRGQLAVTLAYQLGRLEGKSPQVVEALVQKAIEQFGAQPVEESPEITDQDLGDPKIMVYPRVRRMKYQEPQILQIQMPGGNDTGGDSPEASN